jgi:N-methylhydantoinase B
MDVDPVNFQIIRHRLSRVIDEAVNALKRASGRPMVNESHDIMVSLYTSEGDLLLGGVGFLHHLVGASQATKHILDRFEGDINPGDVFILNDPYVAALHPPDMYVIKPIFFDGELQAFSATFVHVTDIGSIDAGGFSPRSETIFHEGFQTPGLKLVEGGEMREDVLDTILNMSRAPEMVDLDFRSEIAANNVAEDRLEELMGEYGAEPVTEVAEHLVEQSETELRERLRELPDGRWEARQYIDSVSEDRTLALDLTLIKDDDSLIYDFEGTSPQSETGLNSPYWATFGGVFAPLLTLLAHDIVWNDGVVKPVEVNVPEGTVLNPERPAPVSIATVGAVQSCNNISTTALSKMLGSTDSYAEEATAVWNGAHINVDLEVESGDETIVRELTDAFAGAGGARAFADGIDVGGELANTVLRWGNVERHERDLPLVYLTRRMVEDSGGAGEYRGGLGHEFAVTPYPPAVDEMTAVTFGKGGTVPLADGLFGGYPGSNAQYLIRKDTAVWGDGLTVPTDLDDTLGASESVEAQWGVQELEHGDVFALGPTGSGGYGDPIERDPEAVRADVADGKVRPETARSVYGVPVDDSTADVEGLRAEIRTQRLAEAGSATPPVDFAETEPSEYRLGESVTVRVGPDDVYCACDACDTVLSTMDGGWKADVVVRSRDPSVAGAHRESQANVRLREFVCPHCARLLDCEVALESDGFLTDTLTLE